jgi:hypothetical protein
MRFEAPFLYLPWLIGFTMMIINAAIINSTFLSHKTLLLETQQVIDNLGRLNHIYMDNEIVAGSFTYKACAKKLQQMYGVEDQEAITNGKINEKVQNDLRKISRMITKEIYFTNYEEETHGYMVLGILVNF